MKVNLIIGAGQLGSRHLQGLLRLQQEQIIYVVDPSEISLEMSKERAKEIQHKHTLNFLTDWQTLPSEFDLVIVATGANVRAKVVMQLLESYKVNKMILEKVLFQELRLYETIGNLIKKTHTQTWINHPRRMFSHYQYIKKCINGNNEKANFLIGGSNWGLACSALHFIDLIAYITDSKLESIDMDWIDAKIHESKRADCIEFTGAIKGTLTNGSNFVISSFDGEVGDVTLCITTTSNRWIIQEGKAQKIIHLSIENDFNPILTDFNTELQSNVTTRIAEDLFSYGTCDLPTYQQACQSHIPFITSALKKYIELSGNQTEICPIT